MGTSQLKPEKPEKTTAEFVRSVNQQGGKPNGLKKRFVWRKRRHGT